MFNGKMKAITFSYDDATLQDKRLIEILNRYHLKATFNVNSGLLGTEQKLEREGKMIDWTKFQETEIAKIYQGHEVAAHTLRHKSLPLLSDEDVVMHVEEDRKKLSELVGYEVVGMAYPGGGVNHDDRVVELIKKHTGIQYARTVKTTDSFDLQKDLYRFNPTAFHGDFEKLYELGELFLKAKPEKPMLFYIWGHSFEFDIHDTWNEFEKFCQYISGHEDVFYGTNREVLIV